MNIDILGFIPVLLPIALSPGTSFTLVISNALSGGGKGFYRAIAGTALGIYSHALLIGMGLSSRLIASPMVFLALRLGGTLYLLWLGSRFIRSSWRRPESRINSQKTLTLYAAWLANILNPKAILFYLTVVSGYAGQNAPLTHYLLFASIHVVVMSLWLMIVGQWMVFSTKKINPYRLNKVVNFCGGLSLICYGFSTIFHDFF